MGITVEFYAGTPDDADADVREAFETFVRRIDELGGNEVTGHAEITTSVDASTVHASEVLTPAPQSTETPSGASETPAAPASEPTGEVADGTPGNAPASPPPANAEAAAQPPAAQTS